MGASPYLAEIMLFGGNFAPRGYAFCNGQLLSISQNTALFSLLGTTYGGNGVQTFGLPNFQGRTPIHQGQSSGTSSYTLGQSGGSETDTLTVGNLPAHTHRANVNVLNVKSSLQTPVANAELGRPVDTAPNGTSIPNIYVPAGAAAQAATAIPLSDGTAANTNAAGSVTVQPTGSNIPFSVRDPYLTISFCIALQGIFPSRN